MQSFLRRLFFIGFICLTKHARSLASSDAACGTVTEGESGVCRDPWIVYVFHETMLYGCTGTILDDRHVLTSAHCASWGLVKVPANKKTNLVGYTNSSQHTTPLSVCTAVEGVSMHEDLTRTKSAYCHDLAVLTLEKKLEFHGCQKPICLPVYTGDVYSRKECYSMGWSHVPQPNKKPDIMALRWAEPRVMTRKECDDRFKGMDVSLDLCIEGKFPGKGHESNVLACQDGGKLYQYGVYSAGSYHHSPYVGLYADVKKDLEWIKDHMN